MPRPAERLLPLLIVGGVLIAYANALRTPFLFDDAGILENPALHEFSWATVRGTSRPLVQLSFALDWALGGANPVGYHVVNVAVHCLAALALYGVAARTLGATAMALAIALVWAVHPLQTESVTYVVQRAESLTGLLFLVTLYGVIRGAVSARPAPWYGAAVAACALGMLCKPVMVTAPLVVLLYDRTFLAGSWRAAWRHRRRLYLGLAATWGILLLLLVGQEHESAATAGFAMRDVSLAEFARSQPGVVLRYLRLVVAPRGLVLDYGWPPAKGLAVVAPTLALAAGIGGILYALRGRPRPRFLVLAFLLVLAPSSSVIPIRDLAFEHRMYLPLAPLVALLVLGAWTAIRRARLGRIRERRVATAAVAIVVVALVALTIGRNHDYRSPHAMWTDVAAKRPANPRAWSNLAQACLAEGRVDDAAAAARRALAVDPSYAEAHVHLGRALADRGARSEAMAHYAEAIRLKPTSADAHNNWGATLADEKRFAEAEPYYREALRLRPGYAEAMNNLAVAVMQRGAWDEATALYAEAMRLSPGYAEPHSNLGNLRIRQGRAAEAIAEYERALALRPDYAEVHFNLALALAQQGRGAEARAHAAEAVRLRPDLTALARQAGLSEAR
ncbi:MAG: tetratricopeptide repeat protein [Deltaproteobacteria bacterium]|nr:tetratricopeptide repeat protein [Deltaproteobacteria bacterium]